MDKVPHQRRTLAYLIDILLCLIAAFFLNKAFNIELEARYFKFIEILFIFTQLILFIYLFLFYMFFNGVSIGKAITGIRLVKNNNSNMSLNDIFIRALMQSMLILSILNIFFQLYKRSYTSLFDITTNTHCIFIKDKNRIIIN